MNAESIYSPMFFIGMEHMETYALYTLGDFGEKSLAREMANDLYNSWDLGRSRDFFEVDPPQWTGDGFEVFRFHTDEYWTALKYARLGVYWNHEDHEPNFSYTCGKIEKDLANARIYLTWFETAFKRIVTLCELHPDNKLLSDLLTTMTMFRLGRNIEHYTDGKALVD